MLSLLLAIGGAFAWKFAPAGPHPLPAGTTAATASATGDRRSIAVLLFFNMSGDKDNEYFSDGISEEILNVLARTPNLHVAARTSSFSFKGSKLEVPAIAQELKVRMVLEGSVRKQGDRVASNRSYVLTALGRNDEARAVCERVLAFAPRYRGCRMRIALVELQRGDLPAARQALLQLAQLKGPAAEPLVHAVMDALQGHGDRAALARRLAAFPSRSNLDPDSGSVFGPDHTTVALILLGAPDLAMDYLERTVVEPGNIPAAWTIMLPALDPIRCSLRFQALVEKLKARDPSAARVCGSGAIANGQSAKGEGAGQ